MVLNYIRLIRQFEPTVWVPLFGKDNRYYFSDLFPRVLRAYGIELPLSAIENEFLLLEGQKFSTSKGHAIWVKDAVEAMGVQKLRELLIEHQPKGKRRNLRYSDLGCSGEGVKA